MQSLTFCVTAEDALPKAKAAQSRSFVPEIEPKWSDQVECCKKNNIPRKCLGLCIASNKVVERLLHSQNCGDPAFLEIRELCISGKSEESLVSAL